MNEAQDDRARAEQLYRDSFQNQDDAVDTADTEDELQFIVAFHAGYREALRTLFLGIGDEDETE